MKTAMVLIGALALLACSDKKKHEDAGEDADGQDLEELDAVDGDDVPGDTEAEDVAEDDVPVPPAHVLKYLGRYEHQDDGPDHLMGTAVLDSGPLLVASSTGLAVVDRTAVEAGTVTTYLAKHLLDTSETSNLDGAPAGSNYFPKLFGLETRGTTAYASTRYDGLWVFDVSGSGTTWTVSEVRRLLRPREFTEGLHIAGDLLYVAHHADGVEVLDLASDPANPASLDTLADPLVDAWSVFAEGDGKVWVADGAGGVKLLRFESGALAHITGDTVTTSPGTVLDVTMEGTWIVAAVAGQGITVYEEWTAAQRNTYALPGVCVDVEPMGDGLVAVACRSWVHVVEIDTIGLARVRASARLHRRMDGTEVLTHIGSQVTADSDTLYVAGWDHVDAYRYADSDTDPDIQVSGQRAHFGATPGTALFRVDNAGQGTLEISDVDCPAPLTCTITATDIPPGGRATLSIISDGSAPDLESLVRISSNDPDDPVVPVLVLADLAASLDPLEDAPDFTGTATIRDYTADAFTDSTLTLSDLSAAGQVVHFAVFGSWCPACMPAVASMVGDIESDLPTGATFFLVDQGEPAATIRHVLEKMYIPLTVYLDTDSSAGTLYDQPGVGLPFGRSYVIDSDDFGEPFVTDVFTTYDPAAVLEAISDAL